MIDELKPYPEYKDSGLPWLGMVPESWSVQRIKTVLREHNPRSVDGSGTLLALTRQRGLIPRGDVTDKSHSARTLVGYKKYRPGQIVMNRMQAWSGMFGACSVGGLVSPDYAVFDIIGGHDVKIVLERLKSPELVEQFALESKGIGSGFNRLYTDRFGAITISLPPLDEQAAIVRFLDHANGKIERAIRAKKKLIALLNEQKQAIIHRAVTRGLDANVKLKPSGIPWLGDVPEHWENVPLKVVSTIQSGVTLGKFYVGERLTEFPYLRVANVQAGRLDLSNVKTLRLPSTEAMCSMLEVGDVLMTEGGDPDKLGRGCVWNGEISPCLHQNHIFAVRPIRERLLPEFLSALLGSHYAQQYFLRTAKQTTNLASTNKTTIGRFRVLLPCVREQEAILRWLQAKLLPVATTIARAEREIMLLREYRTTLTADIVTGKLDVREAVKRLSAEAEEALPADDLPDDLEDEDNDTHARC